MIVVPISRPKVDFTGRVFGSWTVRKLLGQTVVGGTQVYLCKCSCGKLKAITSSSLKTGRSASCGHPTNHVGVRFTRLLAVKNLRKFKDKYTRYECLCDCGKTVNVRLSHLLDGRIKSCNCLNRELSSKRLYNPKLPDDKRQNPRRDVGYARWVRGIKAKYEHECFICKVSERLVAHHLDNYNEFVELRTDINNGVCLCVRCHAQFHYKHKGKNVTREDFLNYLIQDLNMDREELIICLAQ